MIFYSKSLILSAALTLLAFHPRLGAEPATFATRVAPVLEKNCTGCHGKDKQKGSLRLDTFAHVMRGSDDRVVVKAKDFAASELHRRITLPASDEDVMPSDGKPLLSSADILLLEKWIAAGAPATEPFDAPALAPMSLSDLESALAPGGGGGMFGGGGGFQSGRIGGKGGPGGTGTDMDQAFSMADLDQKPRAVYQPAPTYPAALRSRKIDGVVTVIL